MSLPYSVLGEYTGSVQSGSFLDSNDTSLFYTSQTNDIWFGLSPNDVIEISSFSTDETLEKWGIIGQDKAFQTVTLTYLNNLNSPISYSYNQLVNPYIFYKNDSILLPAATDLNSIGVSDGTHVVSYNFVRTMAGNISSPLTIKDISPSRTEIKLIPSIGPGDVQYNSFCVKKFPIRDVASILLSISKNLPYDKIYRSVGSMDKYKTGISFLKFAFFLTDDGSIVNFLKNLYEDYVKYTSSAPTSTTYGNQPSTIIRIQGIKTYYNNFLLQNYEEITDFKDIRDNYIKFVNYRLNERFNQFVNSQEPGYLKAKQFCYDFFVDYFYDIFITSLQKSYEDKYFGYFKNVLNFGNGKYFSMMNSGYLDERNSIDDPLTLIIKLSSPIPTDISIKDVCWISNFGMTPYIFTAILQNPTKYKTIKISAPNFGSPQNLINVENSNDLYSSDDLSNPSTVDDGIQINKNIVELNTDYSDYSKFIVFSSAKTRLDIFKSKMIQWTSFSSSLVELNNRYNNSLSSSISYPYYFTEQASLTSLSSEIVNSFDGYESYLFNSKNYEYSVLSGSFISSSYVIDEDIRADEYDQSNRDSLLSNVPQYIINDSNNSDYLTFLNMISHHFDNIYTYISAMPIERQVKNELTSTIPANTLKEMLYSFGWNVEDIIGSLDVDEVYLNSMDSSSYNALSGQQRLQTIWNRILINLPGIYKTKGTLECVNYLMACYGLPSSMITVREYGGTDFAGDTTSTYMLDEKTYMLKFSNVGDYIEGPIPYSTKTVELKFSIDSDVNKVYYPDYKFFPLFTSIPHPYSGSSDFNWSLGFYRVPGQYTGKLIFQMGSGSSGTSIVSDTLPIFNGSIFSTMVRRNSPYGLFESSIDENAIPLKYDLIVQRNEDGRKIFYSTSSVILYNDDNEKFAQWGKFKLTDGNFKGTLDKLSIWDIPINDNDFEEHVNDLNSYGYSGSAAYENLWVRLNWDYPQNMYSGESKVWVDNKSSYYNIPNYYTDSTLTTVNPTLYSASLNTIDSRWLQYYPTGSIDIIAYNFPDVIGSAFSSSWSGYPTCSIISHSVYPYQFDELTYQQDIDASKFGPNKYKNRKIRRVTYNLESRLDSFNRSTSEPDMTLSGESNQLGFFIDPQDSKNKDILRYVGKSGIMDLIGDPANLYSDKYYNLKSKNEEYNSIGNKRTYFNDLLTIYKFYFDKSIFQAIRNILPARANAYTGVVIEPTILERPKYQNRPITSSIQVSYQNPGIIDNNYNMGVGLLWSNFNTDFSLINSSSAGMNSNEILTSYYSSLNFKQTSDKYLDGHSIPTTDKQTSMLNSMSPNYQHILDIKYINYPVRNWPANLNSGYYADCPDNIQHNFYPDFELLPRLWETASGGGPLPLSYTKPINGSVTYKDGNTDGRFLIDADHGVNYPESFFSGSNRGGHPILYYMMKVWDKYYYYSKMGEYVHSESPSDNKYDSSFVYLYKYVIFDEYYMRNLIYFTDQINLSVYDTSSISYNYDGSTNSYLHRVNTFLNTPDQIVSNINASYKVPGYPPGYTPNYKLNINPTSQYFELINGYPRNHYSHKLQQFSKSKYGTYSQGIFVKGRNTINSTINEDGISDGSYPVTQFNTSNVKIVNVTPVIQNIQSSVAGQITPTTQTTIKHSMKDVVTVRNDAANLLKSVKSNNASKLL